MPNPDKRVVLLQKLVSAAKAIITYQVGMPFGCVRLNKIIIWLKPYQAVDVSIIEEYLKATLGLPIGTERLHWNVEALKEYDKKLNKINNEYQNKIFDACYRIISQYDNKS